MDVDAAGLKDLEKRGAAFDVRVVLKHAVRASYGLVDKTPSGMCTNTLAFGAGVVHVNRHHGGAVGCCIAPQQTQRKRHVTVSVATVGLQFSSLGD
jgi:hypothetical protein